MFISIDASPRSTTLVSYDPSSDAALAFSLRDYFTNDWDGDGANAITAEAFASLKSLLANLPSNLPTPQIEPGADGSIGILWREAPWYVYFGLRVDSKVHYYIDDGNTQLQGVCKNVMDTISALAPQLREFSSRYTAEMQLRFPLARSNRSEPQGFAIFSCDAVQPGSLLQKVTLQAHASSYLIAA